MITDGVPTTYTLNANQPGSSYDFCGDGASTQESEIYNAVQLANAIKAKGSKMFILGVGGDLNAAGIELIKDISGNTLFNPNGSGDATSVATADYALATEIDELDDSLAALSANLCPLVTDLETTAVCGVDGTNGTITIDITTNADAPYTITINNGTPIITNNTQTVVSNLPAGSYEVTVSANDICFETATSTVEVSVQTPNNAGENGTLEICEGQEFTIDDLFDALTGNPDEGGTWSPAIDGAGTYTYTIAGDDVCDSDSAQVEVTEVVVEVDTLPNVEACDEYELPGLTNGNYFTAPNGGGNQLSAGNLIKESTIIYIFSSAVGPCPSAESSFTVTINDTPLVDSPENVVACDSFILPELTNGAYFLSAGGLNPVAVGTEITSTTTIFVYAETSTFPNCFAESSFTITIEDSVKADDLADVTACDSYTLQPLTNGAYFTGPNGTGEALSEGDIIDTTQTIYVYVAATNNCPSDETDFVVMIEDSVKADDLADVTACDTYTLQPLTNGAYFTGSNGTGEALSEGDIIDSTQTIYVYVAATNNCPSNETDFVVTIEDSVKADDLADVTACDSYTLQPLTNGAYFTGPNGTGEALSEGDIIDSTQTIYVYVAATNNCPSDETDFVVTIEDSVKADDLADVTACDSYTLQPLTNGAYFTGPNGTGEALSAGDIIDATQTIYVYVAATNNCPSDETDFVVTIEDSVKADDLADLTACDSYTLQPLTNGAYFTGPNGTGEALSAGDIIDATQTIYVYVAATNNCPSDETDFVVTINRTPIVDILEDVAVCDEFVLPVLANGNYYTGEGGTGTQLFANNTIDTTQTIFIYSETGTNPNCFAQSSFQVTINESPVVNIEAIDPLCIDSVVIQLNASPVGGTFSGNGVSTSGLFTASVAGIGTTTITYDYTDGNGCSGSAMIDIVVNALPEVSIDPQDALCIDADAVQLTASPAGGTWSGTGVDENGLFDPSVSGVGDSVITYTFTDNGNGGGNEECNALVLSAIFDGDLSGGLPKGVELYVLQDIVDLSVYGLGSATNGGGTDGVEFTFPADAATAGSYIYVTTNQDVFVNWFGFEPTYVESTATNINGDDAIELFKNGEVIDTYGTIDVNGDFEPWDYTDSWAYRNSNTGPDGTTYSVGNWTYGGRSAWDGATTNEGSNSIMPIGTYNNQNNTCSEGQGTGCTNFAEITITVNPLPEVSIQEVDVLCIDGDTVQLIGFPEGGTWSGSANEQGIFDPSLGSDSVTYTYTDPNGCTNSATLFIEVSDLPIITAAAPVCEDSSTFGTYSVVVTVSDGIVTSPYSNSNQGEIEWLVSNIPNGENAIITVTNQFGCESSVEVIAPECICIELEYSFTDITCFGLNDGKIVVDFVTDGATVLINGEPYNADTNYAPGEYTIQAFFEGNEDDRCFIESTFELTQPDQVNVEVSSTNVSCAEAADGTISIDFLSEGATYTIKKSGIGADLSGQEFFGPGWYVIEATIIDPETSTEFIQNGSLGRVVDPCTDIVIVTITEPQPFECEISTGFNPVKYACGEHKMNYLQANTTGGIGNLTYNWSMSGSVKGWEITSDPTESMIYFSLGFGTATFTVDITDENGCVTTCEYTIESPCSTKGTKPKSGSNGGSGWSFTFGRNAAQPVNTYPNPVKDLLSIEIKEDLDSQLTIEVFDLIGNRTFNKTYDSVQEGEILKVDFSEFKSNVFYVKFNTKHGSFIKKVILDK